MDCTQIPSYSLIFNVKIYEAEFLFAPRLYMLYSRTVINFVCDVIKAKSHNINLWVSEYTYMLEKIIVS